MCQPVYIPPAKRNHSRASSWDSTPNGSAPASPTPYPSSSRGSPKSSPSLESLTSSDDWRKPRSSKAGPTAQDFLLGKVYFLNHAAFANSALLKASAALRKDTEYGAANHPVIVIGHGENTVKFKICTSNPKREANGFYRIQTDPEEKITHRVLELEKGSQCFEVPTFVPSEKNDVWEAEPNALTSYSPHKRDKNIVLTKASVRDLNSSNAFVSRGPWR